MQFANQASSKWNCSRGLGVEGKTDASSRLAIAAMNDSLLLNLPLDRPALHLDVAPGGAILLRGSFSSKFDGSVVDAATTSWPAGAPGGASIDAGGLIDFEGGGFHVTSRDPVRHEVHAVATGEGGAACAALQVASPCLPVRLPPMALRRLMTVADWNASLIGPRAGLAIEVIAPPLYAPPPAAVPYLAITSGLLAAGLAVAFFLRRKKRLAASPAGRLLALASRVRARLALADAVVAAPLAPALDTARCALRAQRIDATSAEGRRIQAALEKVELRIDASEKQARAEKEREAADELVREIESALEAAEEATLAAAPLPQRT